MIWFFLGGMIAGAVGYRMFLSWWVRTHFKRITPEEFEDELRKAGYKKSDVPGDRAERNVSEPDRDADAEGRVGSASGECVENKE